MSETELFEKLTYTSVLFHDFQIAFGSVTFPLSTNITQRAGRVVARTVHSLARTNSLRAYVPGDSYLISGSFCIVQDSGCEDVAICDKINVNGTDENDMKTVRLCDIVIEKIDEIIE